MTPKLYNGAGKMNSIAQLGISKLLDSKGEQPSHCLPWPNPRESIGARYADIGKFKCWELRGEAQRQYLCLVDDIKEYLEKHGDLVPTTVVWTCYMVGRDEFTASPTVFFCCRDAAARQSVRKAVVRSGILTRYGGFRTGDSSRPPHLEDLKRLANGSSSSTNPPMYENATCDNPMGKSLCIARMNSSTYMPATFGIVLQADDCMYISTAIHPFIDMEDVLDFSSSSEGRSDFEFDLDGEDDLDYHENDGRPSLIAETDCAAVSESASEAKAQHHPTIKDVANKTHAIQNDGTFDAGDIVFSSTSGHHPYLDYCLLQLDFSDERIFGTNTTSYGQCGYHTIHPTQISSPIPHHAAIVTYTGSRKAYQGTLSETPVFVTHAGAGSTQELWSVQFQGSLANGDCGSVIINESTGELEGHIIAGSTAGGGALIVPAYQIFNDLHQRFDKKICLSHRFANCQPLRKSSQRSRTQDLDTKAFTAEFRKLLSSTRRAALSSQLQSRSGQKLLAAGPKSSAVATNASPTLSPPPPPYDVVPHIPLLPRVPVSNKSLRFRSMLRTLSETPIRYENPELLDKALQVVPLQRIYDEAKEECDLFYAEAETLGPNFQPSWGYQDCVLRALLKWFKGDFFQWVNNPECSICGGATIAQGRAAVLPAEAEKLAKTVELYQCASSNCQSFVRFPRYNDAFFLLETHRGRVGEWATCFTMLCRALGIRVRWVWNMEDHVWTEVYSTHRRRWVHVDVCEAAWDAPLLYSQGWGKKLSYCIAFSSDGANDVTRRYVRTAEDALSRERVSEAELAYILREIRSERRSALSKDERYRLEQMDMEEEKSLQSFVVEAVAHQFSRIALDSFAGAGADQSCTGAAANSARTSSKSSRVAVGPSRNDPMPAERGDC